LIFFPNLSLPAVNVAIEKLQKTFRNYVNRLILNIDLFLQLMNQPTFRLASRFYIQPSLNTVTDQQSGKETRLEPRLMNLLCMLYEHNGQMISREQITKEIWDDYGNADEGLTQAISYLRKVLDDETKTLIETIPKRGYKLNGIVEEPVRHLSATKKRYLVWIAMFIVIVLAAWWIFRNRQGQQSISNPDALPAEKRSRSADSQPKDSASINSADKIK
jgi:DNA-binding winged helix-turn-helix (wHTH) protein